MSSADTFAEAVHRVLSYVSKHFEMWLVLHNGRKFQHLTFHFLLSELRSSNTNGHQLFFFPAN